MDRTGRFSSSTSPDADSFQRFFEGVRPEIDPVMVEVATREPQIAFWHKLETHDDDVGWKG
jgi:hypothetical protein